VSPPVSIRRGGRNANKYIRYASVPEGFGRGNGHQRPREWRFRFSRPNVNNKLDREILINPRRGKKSGELSVYTRGKINIYGADLRKFIHEGYLADGKKERKKGKKNIFPAIARPRFLFKFLFLSNQERRIFIDQKSPRLFVRSLFFFG